MAENELEEGSKKKSSKLIMILVAVILFLAGGGASFYFLPGDSAETEAELVEGEAEPISEAVYYDLGKSLIVNFPKGSGASLIQISVTLLVEDEESIDALKKHEPMMRNNLLMAISAKGSANLMTREGKEALRAEMLKEIGSVMEKMTGQNKVKDIFFTTFVMQ
ncbi:MAG: flagellar basal body-associated FliL family protein [Methylococcales bacterium]|nr:flagellar basal body-associated FliL family protein [Methylococcales bacterium]